MTLTPGLRMIRGFREEDAQLLAAASALQGLAGHRHPARWAVAGLVTGRQRPGTASGVTFVTLEDEFGMVNVVWRSLAERQRRELVHSQLLQVHGKLETREGIRPLIAHRLTDLTPMLQGLDTRSRDFH